MSAGYGIAIRGIVADQAVFTSLNRRGSMSGYHLVSRSAGVEQDEAVELATWAPSHGSLIVDRRNRVSINFQSLSSQRFALSRTCEGAPEYSGRGGRQLYTHFLLFDLEALKSINYHVFALYHDAMALGYPYYRENPPAKLEAVRFSSLQVVPPASEFEARAAREGLPPLGPLKAELEANLALQWSFEGDRIALAECLLGVLERRLVPRISFSTSLRPSSVRPYRLCLTGAD